MKKTTLSCMIFLVSCLRYSNAEDDDCKDVSSQIDDRLSNLEKQMGKIGKPTPISTFRAMRSIPAKFGKGKVFVYDVLVSNEGGDYNNKTGIYTAPVDGYYLFHYSYLSEDNTGIYLDLKTSTGRTLNRLRAGRPKLNEFSDAGGIVKLVKGEQVMPVIYDMDTNMKLGHKTKLDPANQFTGYLLRAI